MNLKGFFVLMVSVLSLTVFFQCPVLAQQALLKKLSALKAITSEFPIEKIHIHTNLPFYYNTDTIWFKAYVINTSLNRPSDISETLVVNLIDPTGKKVAQAKLKLKVGLADGYFTLSDSLRTGTYLLSAYTNTLKSYGDEFYYQKRIAVNQDPNSSLKRMHAGFAFSLFPEGGDLVDSINSVVGFKAQGENGLGIKVNGTVIDDVGNIITNFSSEYLGMGRFNLTPKPGREYFVEVKAENGENAKFPLPKAFKNGCILKVEDVSDSISITIFTTADLVGNDVVLVASQDGLVRTASKENLSSLINRIVIDKASFYTGVIQFTLFDNNANPLAERLFFCNHYDLLNIETKLNESYGTREKVDFSFKVKNSLGQPEIGSLSVSIYNETEYPSEEADDQSIYADLLLMSDLKGFIEKPNSYFLGDSSANAMRLDYLMLTQGWRRFSWRNKLNDGALKANYNSIIANKIQGVVKLPNNKLYQNKEIVLYQYGVVKDIRFTKTDSIGRFSFTELNLQDTNKIVIAPVDQTIKRSTVEIDELNEVSKIVPVKQLQNKVYWVDTVLSNKNKRLIDEYKRRTGIILKQVDINAKKPVNAVQYSTNLNGAGKADAVVLAKNLETTHDLTTYLINNITGLKLLDGIIYSRDLPEKNVETGGLSRYPGPMLVVYDGVITDQKSFKISEIDPNDVASVEILKGTSAALYGINGLDGVIIITLKRGVSNNTAKNDGRSVKFFNLIGYQSKREFYSPVHDNKRLINFDARKALYWNPSVLCLQGESDKFSFSNSDYVGRIKVVVEGMNAEGQLGRAVYYYVVK